MGERGGVSSRPLVYNSSELLVRVSALYIRGSLELVDVFDVRDSYLYSNILYAADKYSVLF